MKNADMPAMPQNIIECQSGELYGSHREDEWCGLTKREEFTKFAMQSVLNNYNPYESGEFDSSDYETTAKHCVALADAVLARLEK